MKLFLASEAKYPESMQKLEKFVGGLKDKSIAYIPTAANGEDPYDDWRTNSSTWNLVNTLRVNVTPVVLEEYKNSSVLEIFKGKDIIWVAGGMCGYLMYWMRRCEIDKHIREILVDTVYVGSSAGSMIAGSSFYIGKPYEEIGADVIPGLGLVDFEIFPHYEDEMYELVKKNYKGSKIYLLKNGEAITVVEGRVKVLGEERIIIGQ